MYRSLDAPSIAETIDRLKRRVSERFPESGLARVAGELCSIMSESEKRRQWIGESHLWLRVLVAVVAAVLLALILAALSSLKSRKAPPCTIPKRAWPFGGCRLYSFKALTDQRWVRSIEALV